MDGITAVSAISSEVANIVSLFEDNNAAKEDKENNRMIDIFDLFTSANKLINFESDNFITVLDAADRACATVIDTYDNIVHEKSHIAETVNSISDTIGE